MATKILNSGRIRKVTITEIENEEEWSWPDPGCFEEYEPETKMKSTEEVFEVLDNVVQDWKKQLEVIVAEGLKTIKKTTREKKMKMKYLPGDGLIGGSNATLQARCEIISEWKNDITAAIDATHKKLNNLGDEKVKGTDEAVKAVGVFPDNNGNNCTTVSLDFNTLMRDLDALYAKYNLINNMNKIPIYNVQNDALNKMTNHTPFPWYKQFGLPAQTSMFDYPTPTNQTNVNNKNILSLLHDFVSDQKSQKSIMDDWKKYEESRKKKVVPAVKKEVKTTRRGRDSVQKMKERREVRKYKQYLLREIVRKGETHFYLMKKEVEEPQSLEVEDIFADWNKNLREIKRPRKLTPRVRKISHRAERKEMLKDAKNKAEKAQGPLTYSQMLKKNLKIPVESPPVEEMFGPWMKNVEKMYKPSKATNAADDLEVFKNWNFIFEDKTNPVSITAPPLAALECGQPTVPRVTSKTSKVPDKASKKQTLAKLNAKLLEVKKENKKTITSNALAVRSKTDLVPYVEKTPIIMDTLDKIAPTASGFKPSQHSQRNIVVNDVPVNTFIGPINKPRIPTPPPMPNINWQELLATPANKEATTVAKKNYKTEEIFDHWRHIFIDVNKATNTSPKSKRRVQDFKQDVYFMEWLRNLDEPENSVKERREKTIEDKENKTPSPKSTKRAEKKLVREQFIADDVTEIKDNRRNDFMKSKKIKEKKRTEASRNSLGKRVK